MLSKFYIREFWEQVDCKADNECWPWCGDINPLNGFPMFERRPAPGVSLSQKARGLAYQLAYGWDSIPSGSYVYTTCRDKICVNPAHLKLGHTIVTTEGLTKAQKKAFERFQGIGVRDARL